MGRLVAGGSRVGGSVEGFYIQPTILPMSIRTAALATARGVRAVCYSIIELFSEERRLSRRPTTARYGLAAHLQRAMSGEYIVGAECGGNIWSMVQSMKPWLTCGGEGLSATAAGRPSRFAGVHRPKNVVIGNELKPTPDEPHPDKNTALMGSNIPLSREECSGAYARWPQPFQLAGGLGILHRGSRSPLRMTCDASRSVALADPENPSV